MEALYSGKANGVSSLGHSRRSSERQWILTVLHRARPCGSTPPGCKRALGLDGCELTDDSLVLDVGAARAGLVRCAAQFEYEPASRCRRCGMSEKLWTLTD